LRGLLLRVYVIDGIMLSGETVGFVAACSALQIERHLKRVVPGVISK